LTATAKRSYPRPTLSTFQRSSVSDPDPDQQQRLNAETERRSTNDRLAAV
jgi:hypothetical protein